MTGKPRAVAVVRVSAQGDRAEEHFHSPDVQLDSAKRWARKRRERFVAHFGEIDVSGKRSLAKRPGLLRAVEMVEAGQADHIVVAYFDRLVRSLKVQLEVIERVERAGGEIFALDHGKLTNGTAATRLSTNMMGAVFQYFAEVTGEKVTAAQARAVARGVVELADRARVRARPGRCAGGRCLSWRPLCARYSAPRRGRHDRRAAGVPARARDRAGGSWCGVDVALADVPRRVPFRRAAQPERS